MQVFYMENIKTAHILPKEINLNQIDDSPGHCCMSYGFDVNPLVESISRIGLVNSPIVAGKGEGGREDEFVVVAGFRRVRALRSMGKSRILCRILPPEISSFEQLLIGLYDNLAIRELNPVETGMVLARLVELIPIEDVLKSFMPLFNLPSHKETLQLYIRIEREFENITKDLLAGGDLSMKAAKLLLEIDSIAREGLCGYFSVIKFSRNQQAQFIDFVNDLSHIENAAIPALLDEHTLREIRDDAQMNNPQKAKSLIKLLRTRRAPRLVNAEKGFRRMVGKLKLPPSTHITPPPFFEGPHYRLEVFFKTEKT